MEVKLDQAAALLDRFARVTLPAVGVEAQRTATAFVAEQEVIHAPVGSETAITIGIRRLRADPHPGKLRGSVRTSVDQPVGAGLGNGGGYPIPGAAEFEQSMAGLVLGTATYVTDDADERGFVYAWPVGVVGRSTNSLGRASGSLTAPVGIAYPAVQAVEVMWPAIVARAIETKGVLG